MIKNSIAVNSRNKQEEGKITPYFYAYRVILQKQKLLDLEVASLYVPADKSAKAIIKIRHLGNQEFYINQMEAPREFLLKVVETICGGGNYHKEGSRVTISI